MFNNHREPDGKQSLSRSSLRSSQLKVLVAFEELTAEMHVIPTVREVGARVGMSSSSTVHNHVKTLTKLGFLKPTGAGANRPRSLISHAATSRSLLAEMVCCVPLVGRVAAGVPTTAVENIEDDFDMPASFVKKPSSFMLKVNGNSMIEDGIVDGDVILVDPEGDVSDGRIVVALVSDEATVKRIFRESDNRIRLQPSNCTMDPIYAHVSDVSIVGAVGALYHRF